MNISSYFDPRTELNTWENFKELNWKQQAITGIVSAIAAVIFPIYGGYVACRALVDYFSKNNGVKPFSETKSSQIAKPLLSDYEDETDKSSLSEQLPSEKHIEPEVNRDIDSMVDWKKMMYRGLAKGLASEELADLRLQHGFAEERGDCFFHSVAQLLNKIDPGGKHTKKSVRLKIQEQVQQRKDDRYSKLLNGNVDGITYENFLANIGNCVEDITEGSVIWGDSTCMQLVADAYDVNIVTHSVSTFELSAREALEDQYNELEMLPFNRDSGRDVGMEICTFIDSSHPVQPKGGPARHTINLGCMTRGPWGHWVPLFPG